MTVIFAMPGAARRKHGSSFRGVALRIRNAADEPPLVLVEDAVMPLAHRQVEAMASMNRFVRTGAVSREDHT
jgi:hypothetical protein